MSQAKKNFLLTFILISALCPSSTVAFAPTKSFQNIKHNHLQSKIKDYQIQNAFHSTNTKNQNQPFNLVGTTTTSPRMMAPAAAATSSGAAAVMGVISGGLLGGALHAIAGPDHLAALLPKCCGQRWYRAGRIGAMWGMGHGISATLLGLTAFGLKSRISSMPGVKGLLLGVSSAMEIAVGSSLILIGLLGIKEAREWEEEIEVSPQSLSAAAADAGVKSAQKRAVIFNGILHGFSWDGAPSLAPALAVATWRGSLSFLLAYALGTVGAMTITTTLIGEGTRRAGEVFNRPDIPQKLSLISSILAMGVGVFWCYLAFK